MTTTNRDFRVKHGLNVAEGGTFGNAVTVGTPTQASHATTKTYVDSLTSAAGVAVSGSQPASPSNGDLWFDTVTERIYVYYSAVWIAIATLADAEVLPEHIHDTAIGGTGQIATTFIDAGFYYEAGNLINAGFYNTTSFDEEYSGGIATEVYN